MPAALALRNEALFGPVPLRVEPDISMDADAQSGMLIGLTQTFPDGVYYDQFKEGGTSLASPLLAGVIADADQAAGTPLGFLNPALYKAYDAGPGRRSTTSCRRPSPNSAAVDPRRLREHGRPRGRVRRQPPGDQLRRPGDLLRRARATAPRGTSP